MSHQPHPPGSAAGRPANPALPVLLTGASGFVGHNLSRVLGARGHVVRPVSRRHGIDMRRLLTPTDWLPLLDGVGAVVNSAGIIAQTRGQSFDTLHTRAPVALFEACRRAGVRRVVQISALGADATACSAYHLSKRAADQALLQLGLEATVLRPALVYGRGGTSAAFFLRLAALPLIPVLERGDQPLQPVHISDLVAAVVRALAGPPPADTLDVVGPQTLTFAEWMQTLRAAQGRLPGRLVHVPYRAARRLCWLGQALHPLATPDNLHMLRHARAADPRAAEQFLGRPLRRPEAHLQFQDATMVWSEA